MGSCEQLPPEMPEVTEDDHHQHFYNDPEYAIIIEEGMSTIIRILSYVLRETMISIVTVCICSCTFMRGILINPHFDSASYIVMQYQ